MEICKKTYEGDVREDIYGSWEDCDRGIYVDADRIDAIIRDFIGKRVRITVEVIDSETNAEAHTPAPLETPKS
jgi:hypothetical protein